MQPVVHGRVATMYDIIRMSCQSWSSVDVIYVQPPQVRVRKTPMKATNPGNRWLGFRVSRYHRPTSANRGPIVVESGLIYNGPLMALSYQK